MHPRSPLLGLGLFALLSACKGGDAKIVSSPGDACTNEIRGRVWLDDDCDGLQAEGEPGIAAVGLLLSSDEGFVERRKAGQDGRFEFVGLCPGTYTLEVDAGSVPSGLWPAPCDVGDDDRDSDCSPATIELAGGGGSRSVDFGYCPCAGVIGDRVWHDLDCDGRQDAGEPGLEGVRLELRALGGALLEETSSGPKGSYAFGGLCPGTYVVAVDETSLPPGFYPGPCDFADDTIDSDCSPVTVVVNASKSVDPTVDFGFCTDAEGVIGDFVWHDLDCDGVQDAGEPGVSGVTLRLLNTEGRLVDKRTTDETGLYEFTGVRPGTYAVVVDPATLPPGFFAAPCDAGGDDARDSDCSGVLVTLGTDEVDPTVDFGYCFDCDGRIGDRVWHDLDCDGVQDPGEPGLERIGLWLRDATGRVVAETFSTVDGAYQFLGLQPGTYGVEVDPSTLPPGFEAAPCGVGDPAFDSDCSPATVELDSCGGYEPTVDFGFCSQARANVGDHVWVDVNGDGLQQPGEPGLEGVRLTLKDHLGVEIAAVTSKRSGFYRFGGLRAGAYRIELDPRTIPPCFEPSPCDVGGDDAIDSECSPATVVLATDEALDGSVDFGFRLAGRGAIGDFVWRDLDGDGSQDPGEPGVEGVCALLWDSRGVLLARSTTDASGAYRFDGLCSGRYRVDLDPATVPPCFDDAPCAVGDAATDSNCRPAFVTLFSDDHADTSVDFGFIATADATIGDFAWEDLDTDGRQEALEPGLEGIRVTLLDRRAVVIARTTSNHNGLYLFGGLCAGDYLVVVEPASIPLGFVPSPCDVGDDTLDSDCSPVRVGLASDASVQRTIDFGFHQDAGGADGGCSAGYWRQPAHFATWPAEFPPDMPFGAVFADAFPGESLRDVLATGGGGLASLGRHAVAALLNAASPDVGYPLSTDAVIALFDGLYPATHPQYEALKSYYEVFNARCPLD